MTQVVSKVGQGRRPIPSTPTTMYFANDRPLLPSQRHNNPSPSSTFTLSCSYHLVLSALSHFTLKKLLSSPPTLSSNLRPRQIPFPLFKTLLLFYLGKTKNKLKTSLPLFRCSPRTKRRRDQHWSSLLA